MYEKLNKIEKVMFDVLACALVLFYSYSAIVKPASTQYHRGIYVIITYILVFLAYKSRHVVFRVLDYILMLLGIFAVGYWILMFEQINYRTGAETPFDQFVAIIGVLIGIEIARRVVGVVFVVIGCLMLIFGVQGANVPETWTWVPGWIVHVSDLISHAGDTFPQVCTSIFYKSDGVFGIMANVLATYVILFVLFGAFLEASGAQRFFIDFPLAAVGHKTGGPAKVSVIASGLFGSISGSAIANTVSTGAFTIPMMKRAGFRPHVAGGVEPAASISGMFMPPIMGAGGFIMAELTGLPYSRIMLVAIFPAMMYVFSVFTMVHYEAKIHGIKGERSEKDAWEIFKTQWVYAAPLIVITYFMLAGYSPGYSAIIGLATCVAISHKTQDTKIDLTVVWIMLIVVLGGYIKTWTGLAFGQETIKTVTEATSFSVGLKFLHPSIALKTNVFDPHFFMIIGAIIAVCIAFIRRKKGVSIGLEMRRFVHASRGGAESSLKIGATVGVIGIIIGVLTYSGLVLTFADIMIELAGGSLVLTILLIALASLVLGMGVPVTAAYLITAVVAVPALTHLGVNEVAAHMIVYWLSQDSNITPPVCIAAFAGATIAKANMWRTAFASFKFAKFLYLGPFLFGYVPGFSLNGSAWDIVISFALIALGTYIYAYLLSLHWLYFLNGSLAKKRAAQAARFAARKESEATA